MDLKTIEFLENLFTYMNIMNNINIELQKLIDTNNSNSPEQNMDLFYYLVIEIIRIMPYSYNTKKDVLYFKDDGIRLLKDKIDYLEEDYNLILSNSALKKSLINIYLVRNKFIHEPHNLSFGFSVGGRTSYSMGIYYKDDLQELSTIDLQVLIKELNIIFDKIKQDFINIVEKSSKKFKDYPIWENVLSFEFMKYNADITVLPEYFLNEIEDEENA